MAFLFQVWDTGGNLVFDQTTAIGRVVGVIALSNGSNQSGSINVPSFSVGIPFYFAVGFNDPASYPEPSISHSGTTLSWSPSVSGKYFIGNLFYGVA